MELRKNTLLRKDPDSTLDYVFDWYDNGNGFLGTTDTISSAAFTATTGLTVSSSSNSTQTATVWISGGTVGQTYTVNCRMTSAAGRIKDASFKMLIEEN